MKNQGKPAGGRTTMAGGDGVQKRDGATGRFTYAPASEVRRSVAKVKRQHAAAIANLKNR